LSIRPVFGLKISRVFCPSLRNENSGWFRKLYALKRNCSRFA
jgi:hypothetical protein